MIIVEGPDNAGKTTLCAELQRLGIKLQLQHSGGPIKSREDFDARMHNIFAQSNCIIDRFPSVSEAVYGPLFNRDMGINFQEATAHALRRGFMFIYCRPSLDHLLDFAKHRPSEHTQEGIAPEVYHKMVEEKQTLIISRYDMIMSIIPHIRYDFTTANELFIANLVEACRRFVP